jgi:hypothetical protein
MGDKGRKRLWGTLLLAVLGVGAALVVPSMIRQPTEEIVEAPPAPPPGPRGKPKVAGHGKRLPRPKACLTAATVEGLEGEEMAAYRVEQGLDSGQINAAFQPYLTFLNGCRPDDGEDHSGHATFELHVGCDGVVDGVEVADDSLYEQAMMACLIDRLRYVEFPAHDDADGVFFEYPLIFH